MKIQPRHDHGALTRRRERGHQSSFLTEHNGSETTSRPETTRSKKRTGRSVSTKRVKPEGRGKFFIWKSMKGKKRTKPNGSDHALLEITTVKKNTVTTTSPVRRFLVWKRERVGVRDEMAQRFLLRVAKKKTHCSSAKKSFQRPGFERQEHVCALQKPGCNNE